MDIKEFKKKLEFFYKDEKYQDLLSFFKENRKRYNISLISNDEYIVYMVIISLIKTKNHKYVINFLEMFNPNSFGRQFPKIIWHLKKSGINDLLYLRELLEFIENPEELDASEITYNDKKYPSNRERWFLEYVKILYSLGEFLECIKYVDKAFSCITKFHQNNNVWLLYRKGLSLIKLKKYEDAEDIFKRILKFKRDFYLYHSLAEIYFNSKKIRDALSNILIVLKMNKKVDIKFKIKTILLVQKMSEEFQKRELAKIALSLIVLIYKKEGWKISSNIEKKAKEYQVSDIDNSNTNLINLYNEFIIKLDQWEEEFFDIGVVLKIMHNNEKGMDGWLNIKKRKVYFKITNNQLLQSQIKEGTKVKAIVIEQDNNTNKTKERAIIKRIISTN